jgi:hypothetical protein
MATLINQTKMVHFNEAYAVTHTNVSASTEYALQIRDKHWKYVLVGTCAEAGNITFKAGDSPLAGGDVVVPVAKGTFAITLEDALVKINAPHTVGDAKLLDVVLFSSSIALTNVMIIKLP